MPIPILGGGKVCWYCPNCDAEACTGTTSTDIPFHPCSKLGAIMTPLIRVGEKAKVEAKEREDYIGDEQVQTDANGRPVMSVVVTRDEGQDCTVFPPSATIVRE